MVHTGNLLSTSFALRMPLYHFTLGNRFMMGTLHVSCTSPLVTRVCTCCMQSTLDSFFYFWLFILLELMSCPSKCPRKARPIEFLDARICQSSFRPDKRIWNCTLRMHQCSFFATTCVTELLFRILMRLSQNTLGSVLRHWQLSDLCK